MLVFAGDLHASETIYSSYPSMRGDSEFALEQLTAFCRSQPVTTPLVLLGDNFDKQHPPAETVGWVLQKLRGLHVVYIVGQHDRQYGDFQWLDLAKHCSASVTHLSGDSVAPYTAADGVSLWGFDNLPRDQAEATMSRAPICDIVCVHQLFPQAMGLEGAWTFDPAWVKQSKLLLAGDYHGNPDSGVTGDVNWFYTGSSSMRSISEPTLKSFITVEKSKGTLSVSRRKLVTRPFIGFAVTTRDSLLTFCDQLPDRIAKLIDGLKSISGTFDTYGVKVPDSLCAPFIALKFSTSVPEVPAEVKRAISPLIAKNRVHLHMMPMHDRASSGDLPRAAVGINTQDVIDTFVDKTVSPNLHEFVSNLAGARQPNDYLLSFRNVNDIPDASSLG